MAFDKGPYAEDGSLRVTSAGAETGSGTVVDALPPGRATPANSVPVVLSTEDQADNKGTYRRAAAVGATAGDGLVVTGVTTAGTITLTLVNGGSLTLNVALGSTILPLGVTAAALGTAVGGSFQSLFYT